MRAAICVVAAALSLCAQPKNLVNAKVQQRSAASGLEGQVRSLLASQPQPAWIGYSVPSTRTSFLGCDYVRDGMSTSGVVHLEPPDHIVVLYRVDGNAINRIRTISPDCEIDAGGVPVYWLSDVQPAQSVNYLASLIPDRERVGDSPLNAIAQHGDPAADQVLERYLAPTQPESQRQRVVSLMASARGRHGFEVLRKLITSDPDERVRERAVSSLANSREPEALDLMISIASKDTNAKLREQAVSALSRKSTKAVLPTLTKVVESDPDAAVRRRAVTALNQLPDGDGIPTLIQVVKTSQNPEVRKAAMNSLGQSRDPRAVAFFEYVLKH